MERILWAADHNKDKMKVLFEHLHSPELQKEYFSKSTSVRSSVEVAVQWLKWNACGQGGKAD